VKGPAPVRNASSDLFSQDRLDRTDKRGSDGASGEAGDQRDYGERS
jgi:hypothetical protein